LKKTANTATTLYVETEGIPKLALCSLSKANPQSMVEQLFDEGRKIVFTVKGGGKMHLAGWFSEVDDMQDIDDFDDFSDDDMEDEDGDEAPQLTSKGVEAFMKLQKEKAAKSKPNAKPNPAETKGKEKGKGKTPPNKKK